MTAQNPIEMNVEQTLRDTAAQLIALEWVDQESAQRMAPVAEAVSNLCVVLCYQASTGLATRADFQEAVECLSNPS